MTQPSPTASAPPGSRTATEASRSGADASCRRATRSTGPRPCSAPPSKARSSPGSTPLVHGEPRAPPEPGDRVERVEARGKHLLIRFAGGTTLHTHMRMTGAWRTFPADRSWRAAGGRVVAVVRTERRRGGVLRGAGRGAARRRVRCDDTRSSARSVRTSACPIPTSTRSCDVPIGSIRGPRSAWRSWTSGSPPASATSTSRRWRSRVASTRSLRSLTWIAIARADLWRTAGRAPATQPGSGAAEDDAVRAGRLRPRGTSVSRVRHGDRGPAPGRGRPVHLVVLHLPTTDAGRARWRGHRGARHVIVRSADGTPIAVERIGDGDGPPLVVVPGALSDVASWGACAPLLADGRSVHVVDRRGRGASGDAEAYEVEREIEDVLAVLDGLARPTDCSATRPARSSRWGPRSARPLTCGVSSSTSRPCSSTTRTACPPDLPARLDALLAEGDADGALETFLREGPRTPDPKRSSGLRARPGWQRMLAMVRTVPVRRTDLIRGSTWISAGSRPCGRRRSC